MKRIIPIFLIIVIICCIVLPFSVSAFIQGGFTVNSNPYIYNGITYYGMYFKFIYKADLAKTNINISDFKAVGQTIQGVQINIDKYAVTSNSSGYRIIFYDSSTTNPNAAFTYIFNLDNSIYGFGIGYFSNTNLTDNTWNGSDGILFNKEIYIDNEYVTFILSKTPISSTYTINFNSNGGSTIEPISDIEPGSTVNLDVTFGGITTYNPAFVPEREGYIFDYWYQIDYPLTPVHSITVNDDISLIAKWSNDPALAHITFGDGFYSDINHSAALTGGYYEIGSYIDFYTYYSGSKIYRGKVAFTDLNDNVTYYQGPSGSYRYHVQITESGSFSLVLLDYCTTYVSLYPDVEGTYVSHIQYAIQDGEWHNYTFDDALTIQPGNHLHFRFYLTAPYVITEGVYYYTLIDYENVFIRSDVKTNNNWQTFWSEVYLDFTVNHSGTLYLYVKSISDYDITSRDIVGIYDESTGEFSWAVSEVSLLDTNWEDVASNVPQNLAYMFDGIYSLSGLAIIVPLCMMVAFGLWFIRRS